MPVRHCAGFADNGCLCGGGGDLSGGNCAGEDKGDDGCANNEFHFVYPFQFLWLITWLWFGLLAHSTRICVAGIAHRHGHCAGLGDNSCLGRGRRDLRGGYGTGKDESDDDCANDELHFSLPQKLYLLLKDFSGLAS